ncbi:MAG TPA: hypothetical protein VL944_03325 [Candidatus Acidoferrum sp.]|nr:hypothetical protein [Candidatus Acidoferrum sp.]
MPENTGMRKFENSITSWVPPRIESSPTPVRKRGVDMTEEEQRVASNMGIYALPVLGIVEETSTLSRLRRGIVNLRESLRRNPDHLDGAGNKIR